MSATFESNRFDGLRHSYREDDLYLDGGTGAFARLIEASGRMISSSDGWAPNRAWRIYQEAYDLNVMIDLREEWRNPPIW